MHGPFGEQLEDGGTDIAAPAATTAAAAAAMTPPAGTARSEGAGAEARTEAGAEAESRSESETALAAVIPHMIAELFAHLPTGCTAFVMSSAPVGGADER
ncbi:hypothetical protein MPHO_41650 [Mycolicibacterium phocaicum]|nr:hypothetical protein MPHO_41650 [Mycolicibacterium phocaicum]